MFKKIKKFFERREHVIWGFAILIMGSLIADSALAQYTGSGAYETVKDYLKKFATHLIPTANNTYDIGSSSKKVRNVYVAGSVVMSSGNVTGPTPPGGSANHVQYNNGTAFAGSANFTYNPSSRTLSLLGGDDGTYLLLGTANRSYITDGYGGVTFNQYLKFNYSMYGRQTNDLLRFGWTGYPDQDDTILTAESPAGASNATIVLDPRNTVNTTGKVIVADRRTMALKGDEGALTASAATLAEADGDFTSSQIVAGDPIFIKSSANSGWYRVASVDNATQITLDTAMTANATGVKYQVYSPGVILDPAGGLQTHGKLRVATKSVSAATYNTTDSDYILNVDYTATGAVTNLQLMTALMKAGRIFVVKDSGGSANSNNVTITTEGAEKIDGEDTYVLNADYQAINIETDGSNWFVY